MAAKTRPTNVYGIKIGPSDVDVLRPRGFPDNPPQRMTRAMVPVPAPHAGAGVPSGWLGLAGRGLGSLAGLMTPSNLGQGTQLPVDDMAAQQKNLNPSMSWISPEAANLDIMQRLSGMGGDGPPGSLDPAVAQQMLLQKTAGGEAVPNMEMLSIEEIMRRASGEKKEAKKPAQKPKVHAAPKGVTTPKVKLPDVSGAKSKGAKKESQMERIKRIVKGWEGDTTDKLLESME